MNSLTECPTVSPPVPTTQKTESTTAGERRTDNNGILQTIKIKTWKYKHVLHLITYNACLYCSCPFCLRSWMEYLL